MGLRKILMGMVTLLLAGAILSGMVNALEPKAPTTVVALENVRSYAPGIKPGDQNYAVDGGLLYAGVPGSWQRIKTPRGALVNAVAISPQAAETIFIGLANELALYRSEDSGASWQKVPLATEAIGSVTHIAVDAANRLVYVGTDVDGVHRLRDVGTSMIAAGHLVLDEPVEEVVTESTGKAMAFVRTRWHLYRAEEAGLRWVEVDSLPSPATAVAIAGGAVPTVYVGTASSGVRVSTDGVSWQPANLGLNYAPGSQLLVNDLAVDPSQPELLYVSTSISLGSAVLHTTPQGVSMSTDGAEGWQNLVSVDGLSVDRLAITELMPVTGHPGAVYGLTEASRSPIALGDVPGSQTALAVTAESTAQPQFDLLAILAWILAGLAAIGLLAILWLDFSQRQREATAARNDYVPETLRNDP
jgi:hypothetical protein